MREANSYRRELTPGNSGLREVGQLFDRMYINLNSQKLPSDQQQYDENLLDDLSSFKDKVQVRDFSEYLRPNNHASRKGTVGGELSPDMKMLLQSKRRNQRDSRQISSPAFSPRLATGNRNGREHSVSLQFKETSQLNALLTQRQSEIGMLVQKMKELEAKNRQLQTQIQQIRVPQPQEKQPEPDARMRKLEEEVEFLTQNNQHLYRSSVRLTQQLEQLRSQLAAKVEKEAELNARITELQKSHATLKKLNKQLLKEQSSMVKSSEEEAGFFKTVKEEFEKENALLKKKIQFLQVEKNTSVNALKSVSMGGTSNKFFSSSMHRPADSQDITEVEKLRHEVEQIKQSLHGLSTKKFSASTSKTTKVTPVRKSQWRFE